jgi:pimeloyl-ACP methyl ester carboxylesterase
MNKTFMHWILRLAGLSVFIYVAVVSIVYLRQEQMIFYPTTLEPKYKFQLSLPFEEKYTDTGYEITHGLLIKAPHAKGLVLYFHGNAGDMSQWAGVAQEIALRLHWNVWMVDYPGYGKSTGVIDSQERLLNSARKIFTQAKQEFPQAKIAIYGRSIGSGVAVKIAAENVVQGLVLETPYLSITRLTHSIYPWIPLFALKYPMTSEEWIREVKSPILTMHGDQDDIIPFEHGQTLSTLSEHSTFVRIPEGRHNNLSVYDLYWISLQNFFTVLAGET